MKVLKFGGSVLNSAENIKTAISIAEKTQGTYAIVVSAFGNSTDLLVSASDLANKKDSSYSAVFEEFKSLINQIVGGLLKTSGGETSGKVAALLGNLQQELSTIHSTGELTAKTKDQILSYGELISTWIYAACCTNAVYIDAREIIKTDSHFGKARVDFDATDKLITEALAKSKKTPVVPGFIASNKNGETTTLGRGGSDYTASIIASALNAEILEIWTNVDGVMTANPHIVDKAFAVGNLTYAEAMELSHFGAKVIYSPTIQPACRKNIKILVKNAFNMDAEGTFLIEPKPMEPTKHQYDFDTETVIGFLRNYGLDKDFKLNIEVNHATLAGHTFQHELQVAADCGLLGSIDANRGDYQNGWDTDQFPINIYELVEALLVIIPAGGFTTGGVNFDAKRRRNSTDADDLFIAHIAGMDAFARALLITNDILEKSDYLKMRKNRYASFDSGKGKDFEDGKLGLEELREYAISVGEPELISGKQELFESLINQYM